MFPLALGPKCGVVPDVAHYVTQRGNGDDAFSSD